MALPQPDPLAMRAEVDEIQLNTEQEFKRAFERVNQSKATRFYLAGWAACQKAMISALMADGIVYPLQTIKPEPKA